MVDEKNMVGEVYYPTPEVIASAHIADYGKTHLTATADLAHFWRKIATEDFEWYQPWETVLDERNAPFYKWFVGAKVNIVHNALDRHMRTAVRNKAAIVFEGEPGDCQVLTYRQLNHVVSKFASVLRSMGVAKGDPVTIYMGRTPEQIVAMLACAKIGAVHSLIPSDLGAKALRARINASHSKVLITADGAWSRGSIVQLKKRANKAVKKETPIQTVICVKRTGQNVKMIPGRDYWYDDLMALPIADSKSPTEVMDAEDPLFMLYRSDADEDPKAVLHSHGGYMVGTSTTLKWVFDLKPEDVWWCTEDPSHIAGHSYVVYSPLILGATSFIYEGAPTFPYPDRWWQMAAKYSVTSLFSTPTDIRSLMRFGKNWPARHDLSTLRLLGTTGDVINPEAWHWFYHVIGQGKCPMMDAWVQDETGSAVVTTFPSVPLKPGSPGRPFPGIQLDVVDDNGASAAANEVGHLVIRTPWPAMFRNVHDDTDWYVKKYWDKFKEDGWYLSGDKASKDKDGYIWISN